MPIFTLPDINNLVDLTCANGSSYPSRIEDVQGDRVLVAAPFDVPDGERPQTGAELEMAWLRDGLRYVVPATLVEARRADDPPSWVVKVTGAARRENRRAYVRGGGGEVIRVGRAGSPIHVKGRVIDLGEGGVRCHLLEGDFSRDDRIEITITLGRDVLMTSARVLAVRREDPDCPYELVASYETPEQAARLIRRYVLRLQTQERRRMASA